MQVRVKTKPYKNDSYCSHLVEHCVFSWYSNKENFFEIDCGTHWMSWLGYTIFWISNNKNTERFISHIIKSLDKTVIIKEKLIIKEEIEEKSTGTLLVNKLWKILYGKEFKRYSNSSPISKKELVAYHTMYYQRNNIWILDDDFHIKHRPKFISSKNKIKSNHHKISPIEIIAEGKIFNAYVFKYTSIYEYALCYFLEWLYDVSAIYLYRYIWKTYYPPIGHFFVFTDKLSFVRRKGIKLGIDKNFFDKATDTFLSDSIRLNEICAVNEILKLETFDIKKIKKIILWLDYVTIKKYLEE